MDVPVTKRMLATIRGNTDGPPPIWLMRQAGRYLPEYRATRAQAGDFLSLCMNPELATEVTLQPIRRYGFDASILFADILLLPWAMGQKLTYAEGEGPRLEPIRDAAGLVRLDETGAVDRLGAVYETVSRVRAGLPQEVTLIGFAGAPWTVATYMVEGKGSNDQAAARLWAWRDPEGFGQLIEILVRNTVEYLSRQIQAGAEVVQLFDTWAGSLPEREFERWVTAPIARIRAALKARHPDVPLIAFPKGAGARLEGFAARTGADVIGLDHNVPGNLARRVAQETVVQGNLDPIVLVAGGKALEEEIDAVLETLGDRPFVFNLGHGIIPPTPPENVRLLVDRVRAWQRPARAA
ncbi:uroporphyrinogen decarboxylase [Zavarzinia sp. CC-PAN008]|uniref:uroporphyrinogen decarboxylase n=1 Tax=Zavarzinia sp. CC-PAN008 TaxID=3243332 RepID=UPI003F7467D3